MPRRNSHWRRLRWRTPLSDIRPPLLDSAQLLNLQLPGLMLGVLFQPSPVSASLRTLSLEIEIPLAQSYQLIPFLEFNVDKLECLSLHTNSRQ